MNKLPAYWQNIQNGFKSVANLYFNDFTICAECACNVWKILTLSDTADHIQGRWETYSLYNVQISITFPIDPGFECLVMAELK